MTASMHALLQILAITLFEKMPLQQVQQALDEPAVANSNPKLLNPLNLFDAWPDSSRTVAISTQSCPGHYERRTSGYTRFLSLDPPEAATIRRGR